MTKMPFTKFIISLLLLNNNIVFIVNKLKTFGYYVKDEEVKRLFDDVRSLIPESLKDLVNAGEKVPLDSDWIKYFDIYELYDYMLNSSMSDPPPYFKWCEDCLWIHEYKDIMCIANILLFNDEPLDEISDVIMFRYKKKIGVDALKIYKKMFWDCENLDAKDALKYCLPFRDNAMILRRFATGEAEVISADGVSDDGAEKPVVFHDPKYIKWKLGYTKTKVPGPKEFLEKVQQDSYFKYYESMNMNQSLEITEESGSNDRIGAFDLKRTYYRNVEENKSRLAKAWVDLYLKATNAMPADNSDKEDFFKKMGQVSLQFEDCTDSIIPIDSEIMGDIKGDIR